MTDRMRVTDKELERLASLHYNQGEPRCAHDIYRWLGCSWSRARRLRTWLGKPENWDKVLAKMDGGK